jgi:hypothetical protein
VRFQVLTAAAGMSFRVFWDVAPCSRVEVNRRFRGAYCLHHGAALMMEAVHTSEMSMNFQRDYTALHPRRLLNLGVRSCWVKKFPD